MNFILKNKKIKLIELIELNELNEFDFFKMIIITKIREIRIELRVTLSTVGSSCSTDRVSNGY